MAATALTDAACQGCRHAIALRNVCASTLPVLKKLNLNLPMRYSDKFYEDILASEQCRAKLALQASRNNKETKYIGALASRLLVRSSSPGAEVLPSELYIMSLVVDRAFRRIGAASRLLEDLYESGVNCEADTVSLHVQTNNAPAIELYEDHGFNIVQRIDAFYQIGIEKPVSYHADAYLMRRSLQRPDQGLRQKLAMDETAMNPGPGV